MAHQQRTATEVCPFVPGTGASPPVLAGRDQARARIKDLCAKLSLSRAGAHRPVVLIGPRGNGKTVLLNWLEGHAKSQSIDTMHLTPNAIPTVEALAQRLSGKANPAVKRVGVSAGISDAVSASTDIEFQGAQSCAPPDLTHLLVQRSRPRPFALLIDESHTLAPDVARHVLNAAQDAAKTAPVLLALAGTPDLGDTLCAANATFWNRALKLGVGLLTEEETLIAIAEPLRWSRISLADESLWKRVVDDSQGYPYFVQQWGEELWLQGRYRGEQEGLSFAETPINLSHTDVSEAANNVASVKREYYGDRYSDGLSPSPQEVLQDLVAESVGTEQAYDALISLAHLGFVWKPPGEDAWGPGIPSLMNYVISLAPAPDNAPEPLGI